LSAANEWLLVGRLQTGHNVPVPPNKTKVTGPPPLTLARKKGRTGGSG